MSLTFSSSVEGLSRPSLVTSGQALAVLVKYQFILGLPPPTVFCQHVSAIDLIGRWSFGRR